MDERTPGAQPDEACRSCGTSPAPVHDTADGRVRLCGACAATHDIGCP
ncbi:MAG: hypothetical protein ABIP17_10405 [Ilumatobacteraceae bacterium]